MQLKYYNRKINEAIAKALGYRPWQFGDPWVKGLKLMDTRFENYVRKVIKDTHAAATYVKLNIDKTQTQYAAEVKVNYIPCSHWVSPDNEIKAKPPNFVEDLNAMHIAEEFLTADEAEEYAGMLPLRGDQSYANTAQSRAICWLRAKKIEY
jgi:hypothetical protein